MTGIKNTNLAALLAKRQLPAPKAIESGSKEFERVVEEQTRLADATIAVTDAILDSTPADTTLPPREEENISNESEKLSRLIDDDFPFDESQLEAVNGLVNQQYGCMIGAAGTGKTTVTKKLVDRLINSDVLDEIDLSKYWFRGTQDEHDDYQIPPKPVPSIVMVSFTGRASQQTKKNFPRDWHGNIMTIHRALGFYPEFYMDEDDETGNLVNKRRFVPAYNADNLMPWDIIVIDEAGMLGLDLWHQLWAACKPTTRIIMIGDINQLPPTHGKSILGFALATWPTWELTHIHRQQGANNSIVDNAHRVLKGLRPISDAPKAMDWKSPATMIESLNFMVQDPDWRFLVVDIDDNHQIASQRIRQGIKLLHNKLYEPNRDVIITPTNGYEQTAPGWSLGQAPMNQHLVTMLNQDAPRYFIDAGRERQNFAVGDKVMATVNDYEAGITNGMTGVITSIVPNGGYAGETFRFGLITEVQAYFDSLDEPDDEEFSLEEMMASAESELEKAKEKAKKDAGPASHIVTVRFGEDDHAFEIAFGSKSQVASLMLAYVATCHKLQGGEAPLVFVIVNQNNKRMLTREWLYTAITRASQRCVILTTRQGMGFALGKQAVKGTTLAHKIKNFLDLTKDHGLGPTVRVKIPKPNALSTELAEYVDPVRVNQAVREAPEPRVIIRDRIIPVVAEVVVTHKYEEAPTKDGGTLEPESKLKRDLGILINHKQLPAPAKLVSQWGAIHMKLHLDALKDGPKLLPKFPQTIVRCTACKDFHVGGLEWCSPHLLEPKPVEPVKPANKLAALLAKQKRG